MLGNQLISTTLKIVIGGDCYCIGKFPLSYAELEEIVHSKYESKLPDNYCFKYEDCDNDSINIESQSDYEACQEYCLQEQLRSIKLRVDSKSYKQYYNYYQQQPNSLAGTIGSQSYAPLQAQSSQINGALGLLVNPYATSYQNISQQNKNISKLNPAIPNINTISSSSGQQYFSPGTMESSQNQFLQMMMLLSSQGQFSNSFGNSLRMTGGNIGGGISNIAGNIVTTNTSNTNNNNAGNNSGSNTNAVNQSHSSQAHIPLLSKHTSEVHNSNENPNTTFNIAKRHSSANQSQLESLPQQTLQGNMSFTSGRGNLNSISSSSGQNNINFTFKASNKNAASVTQDLNQTSKFFNQDSQVGSYDTQTLTNQALGNQHIGNPMDSDDSSSPIKNNNIPKITQIRRTNSINPAQEQVKNVLAGNILQGNNKADIPSKIEINQGSATIIQNQDNKSISTAQQQNYSNIAGINRNLGDDQTSQQSNQIIPPKDIFNLGVPQAAKAAQGSSSITVCCEDIDNNKKREFSASPPRCNLDSSNTFTSNKMLNNRPSSLSTTAQRSGSNVQIPCERCIIRSEEQKLKELPQNELKTPTNNALSKDIPFIPQNDCKVCQGTGFLRIEDTRVLNIIQSVMRQKLKESEILLKSVSIRQQKIGKIIPKEIMSCLQRMLNLEEVDLSGNLANALSEPSEQNPIFSFIRSSNCWECKKSFENEKMVYLCIDCKSQAAGASDLQNQHSENSQKQEQNDSEFLLCETCEEHHDSSHRVVQIQKDDIMVMNSQQQQQQQVQQQQQQAPRVSQLEKSIKTQQQQPLLPSLTNFQTSQILSQNPTNINGTKGKTPLTTYLQTQEQISTSKDNFTLTSSRRSDSDFHLQNHQRHDQKSATVIVNPPTEIFTSLFDKTPQEESIKQQKNELGSDSFEDISLFKQSGRNSSNHNFKPQNSLHFMNQLSSKTACFMQDEDPPTFSGPKSIEIQNENLNLDNKIANENEISSNFTITSANPLATVSQELTPSTTINIGTLTESSGPEQIQCDTQVLQVVKNEKIQKSQEIQKTSNENSQEIPKGTSQTSTLICLKSTFYAGGSQKLTQSFVFAQSRNSLTQSIVTQSSQYRAKLLLSFTSDMLSDGSIVVFQEISNNGSENWPNDVFLQCISGITETSYYPAIKVNKGEIMHIAFSLDIQNYLKIQKSQLVEGEQVKTSWRLYYQQVNQEKQFFGPKITISFTYKKPQKSETDDTLESVSTTIHDMMKKIFTEDDQGVVKEFLEINKERTQAYLLEKKEDFSISKLIVQCIEQYVLYRIAKSKAVGE